MKNIIPLLLLTIFLFSCNSKSNRDATIANNVMDTSVNNHVEINDIPIGYTNQTIKEYEPQNEIEENLLLYLHEYSLALEKRDAKKLVELINPDYVVLLQKRIPNKTTKEIRDKLPLLYEKSLEGMISEFTKDWDKAENASSRITNIINRVREGNKLLYLYEYHSMLFNKTDTIFKKETEYSVVSSLDNGKTWYATTNDMEEVYEMLELKFKKSSIDEVFAKH